MSGLGLRDKNRVIGIKAATLGTFDPPGAGDAGVIAYNLRGAPEVEQFERNSHGAFAGNLPNKAGSRNWNISFETDLAPADTSGDVPKIGAWLRAAGFKEEVANGVGAVLDFSGEDGGPPPTRFGAIPKSTNSGALLDGAVPAISFATSSAIEDIEDSGTYTFVITSVGMISDGSFPVEITWTFVSSTGDNASGVIEAEVDTDPMEPNIVSGDDTHTNEVTITFRALDDFPRDPDAYVIGDTFFVRVRGTEDSTVRYLLLPTAANAQTHSSIRLWEDGRAKDGRDGLAAVTTISLQQNAVPRLTLNAWAIPLAENPVHDEAIVSPQYEDTGDVFQGVATVGLASDVGCFTEVTVTTNTVLSPRGCVTDESGYAAPRITDANPTAQINFEAALPSDYNPFAKLFVADVQPQLEFAWGRVKMVIPRYTISGIEDGEREGMITDTVNLHIPRVVNPDTENDGALLIIEFT